MNNMEYLLGNTLGSVIAKIENDANTLSNTEIKPNNVTKVKTKIIHKKNYVRRNYGKY